MRTRQRNSWLAVVGIIAALFMVISGCTTLPAPEKDKTYHLTVLHTNDHHGHFWPNKYGEAGLAAQKSLVDGIRAEVASLGGHTLLLSAGDVNSGIPESSLQNAEPDFKGMGLAGYQAMALGNHEFDVPMETLKQQAQWAGFPFLAANVVDKTSGELLFQEHAVFTFDELKVVVFGLLTEDTITVGNPEYLADIDILPPIETARKIVPRLRKKGHILIALTHMGFYPDGDHGANAPGDVSLARQVPGIDLIVGGHTHEYLQQPDLQNQTLIVQAGEWGKYLGRLDLTFENGTLSQKSYRLIPVNLKKKVEISGKQQRVFIEEEIKPDAEAVALLTPYYESGQQELGQVIGRISDRLVGDRKVIRFKETNLGNFINRAIMEKSGADVVVMNSGGIRDDIEAGEVTYKEVLTVLPFGNTVCTVVVSGTELMSYLEAALAKAVDTGAFAQIAGATARWEGGKVSDVAVNGEAVKPDQTYKLAVNNYMASGGDGYPALKDHDTFYDTGYVCADVVSEYLANQSPVDVGAYAPTGGIDRR